jgi:hypothetical protein
MRNLVIAAATLALATLASPLVGTASAEIEYPYCGYGRDVGSCSFSTLEQCRAYANGIGASCFANPRYTANQNPNAFARTPRTRR